MKPYNERLAMIDEAIELNSGLWPDNECGFISKAGAGNGVYKHGALMPTFGGYGDDLDGLWYTVCTREEFEQRAKELGYINGYRYGVEYETNGEKPNLPDDVFVEYKSKWVGWVRYDDGQDTVENWAWEYSTAFKIYDERYKPKEQEMNNDWYEKGELPPANTECEVKIEGQWLPTVVIGHYANEAVVVDPCVTVQRFFCTTANNLRPLRTETDKLVEQMCDDAGRIEDAELNPFIVAAIERLAEKGYRKVKPMSEQEFMERCVDICGHGSTQLYRAGCRFIDKGE